MDLYQPLWTSGIDFARRNCAPSQPWHQLLRRRSVRYWLKQLKAHPAPWATRLRASLL